MEKEKELKLDRVIVENTLDSMRKYLKQAQRWNRTICDYSFNILLDLRCDQEKQLSSVEKLILLSCYSALFLEKALSEFIGKWNKDLDLDFVKKMLSHVIKCSNTAQSFELNSTLEEELASITLYFGDSAKLLKKFLDLDEMIKRYNDEL